MPVELECVAGDDGQVLARLERRGQRAVPLDGDHLQSTTEENIRQRAPPWPNFKNCLSGLGIERIGDPRQDHRITEEMLAQPAGTQIFSKTSVRSSLAGAPPVNAAMSVNTASRICRAGRARRLTTWLSTRGSPKRSPFGPRASARPSVKRQRIALPRSNGSERSWPPLLRPRGGRVASSRVTAPVSVVTRNAWGCPAFAYESVPCAGSATT